MFEPTAPDASEPASKFYYSQRLRLHYVDWGNPSAPPLILVHGGRDHCRSWDFVARRLKDRWHVLAVDLRGHGDSNWSDGAGYSMLNYVYDLARLIEAEGVERPVIVAHSLGGSVTMRYTGVYPETVRAVVAIEGLGPRTHIEREQMPIAERVSKWMEHARDMATWQIKHYASLDDALVRMREAHPRYPLELAVHLTRHGMTRHEDGTYTWKYDHYIRSFPPNDIRHDELRQLWARIICPVLLVGGGESWHIDPNEDERTKFFRDAEVAFFPKANHWVHHDQFEAFMARLEQFLARLPNT
jgi:pimeloyl-ACP methyl ester carboxylesterase